MTSMPAATSTTNRSYSGEIARTNASSACRTVVGSQLTVFSSHPPESPTTRVSISMADLVVARMIFISSPAVISLNEVALGKGVSSR